MASLFNPNDPVRRKPAPAPPAYVPPTPPPGTVFGRRERTNRVAAPGSRASLFNPANTSPWANTTADSPDPNAPPKFNLLTQTKNQGIADANQAALAGVAATQKGVGSQLAQYLAESAKLNQQASGLLQKDLGTYDVEGLRSELASQDERFAAAARAQAGRATDFASRALDKDQMSRGALGLSSHLLGERSRAYLDVNLPLEQQLADRGSKNAVLLKQMELANAGRGRYDISNFQSQLFNPVEQRLRVQAASDALLNPIVARDQANTFYGLAQQYQPTVPAPAYYSPYGQGAEAVGGSGMSVGPRGAGVGMPVRNPTMQPGPATQLYAPPQTQTQAPESGRTFFFNNGRPAPSPVQQNINLQRALAGENVDSGPSGYYTNGAPMPGRYAAAAQMAALMPYSSAYQRPYQAPAPNVPYMPGPQRQLYAPPSQSGRMGGNPGNQQAFNQQVFEAYRQQTGYYPQSDPNRSDYLLQQIRADLMARQGIVPQSREQNRAFGNTFTQYAKSGRTNPDPFAADFAQYEAERQRDTDAAFLRANTRTPAQRQSMMDAWYQNQQAMAAGR